MYINIKLSFLFLLPCFNFPQMKSLEAWKSFPPLLINIFSQGFEVAMFWVQSYIALNLPHTYILTSGTQTHTACHTLRWMSCTTCGRRCRYTSYSDPSATTVWIACRSKSCSGTFHYSPPVSTHHGVSTTLQPSQRDDKLIINWAHIM